MKKVEITEGEKRKADGCEIFVTHAMFRLQLLWKYFNDIAQRPNDTNHNFAWVKTNESPLGQGLKPGNEKETIGRLIDSYSIPHDDLLAIEDVLKELMDKAKEVYFMDDDKPIEMES
ncbi:MAG: hypothetical protein JW932_12575 [Deltaproteobacteria bacterium]|nr:hypothetical protein [Deltaproteobacteria bacterium]